MEANPKAPVVVVNLDRIKDPALRDVIRNLGRQVEKVYDSVSKVVNFNLARSVRQPGPTPPKLLDGESLLWVRTDVIPEQHYVVSRRGNRISLFLANEVIEASDPVPPGEPPPPPEDPTVTVTGILPSSFSLSVGQTQTLTVAISHIQAEDVTIPLVSTNPNVLSIPANIVVLSGFTQASFIATANAAGSATVSASLNSSIAGSNATVTAVEEGDDTFPVEGAAVATFHCLGLYWNPPADPGEAGCPVRYRENVAGAPWQMGYPLWYDPRPYPLSETFDGGASGGSYTDPHRARGSLVHLTPDTEYMVQFGMPGANVNDPPVWHAQLIASTWSEVFPEGTVTVVASRSTLLHITDEGTPAAYNVAQADGWTAAGDIGVAIIDVSKSNDFCVRVSASYQIIRGFNLKGASRDALRIDPGVTDVVIEDCDISDFGQPSSTVAGSEFLGGYTFGAQERAGIMGWYRVNLGGGNKTDLSRSTKRIIVQRCRIHDPTYGAFPWDYGHPVGPNAIFFGESGGNHVIRYCEIYASTNDGTKWFMDGIGGSNNFSAYGCPGLGDCDIYANRITHVYDDCIEAEGGNRNTRVWRNYTDMTLISIGCTVTHIGPFYAWRNVFNRSRSRFNLSYDAFFRGEMFKAYSRIDFFEKGGGRQFFFHNTALQHPPGISWFTATVGGLGNDPGSTRPQGGSIGITGGGDDSDGRVQKLVNSFSRNNILHIFRDTWGAIRDGNPGPFQQQYTIAGEVQGPNDFDYDLANGDFDETYPGAESTSVTLGLVGAHPIYKAGHGPLAYATGKYQLASNSPGKAKGLPLPNFSDGYPGAAPDIGAHEEGTADMLFGLPAAVAGVN